VTTAEYIKSLDTNHLVTAGMESREDYIDFLIAHTCKCIDYSTIHVWAQNRGIYDMIDPSEENIAKAMSWGLSWVEKVNGWATGIGTSSS
jgi:mannan endo-1,4-beta-mannosidase